MRRSWQVRAGLLTAAALALAPWVGGAADKKPADKLVTFTGKVTPLADVVKKAGGKLDADAAPLWLALVTDDGKTYPLVKDDGSRLFYLDKRLLNRQMRLTGKLVPGSQLLLARSVRSLIKGEAHEVYYWCEICAIRRGEKMICECCGAAMELREDAVKK